MQTLEPAFEQLMRIQVLGSYQTVSSEQWRIALHKHPDYVSERKTLQLHSGLAEPEARRAYCQERLQRGGFASKVAESYCQTAVNAIDFYGLERCARLLDALTEEQVLPHVAVSIIRNALDLGPLSAQGRELLDWCEIAVHVCRHKRRAGQKLRNSAGLLVKIVKDPMARSMIVSQELESSLKETYRRQQQAAEQLDQEQTERTLILEYEHSRMNIAEILFQEMPDVKKAVLRKQKAEVLRQQDRFQRISPEAQEREIDVSIIQDIARHEAPPYEKWRLRKQAQQAVLAFQEPCSSLENTA